MSQRELPARPNLEHLKKQARTLLRECRASEAEATARFAAQGVTSTPKLADALHVIAREYGCETWAALKAKVEMASDDPLKAFTAAVNSRSAQNVKEVLARHPSLKAQINEPQPEFSFDSPAILQAIYQDNREMVDVLLDAGANINERSRWWAGGFGVLDCASPELAKHLIERGATLDIHSASRLGMTERVRELLAADPKLVHARGGDGQLPLHFAATVEIAAMLLDAGADINACDIDHESTALQYMVSITPHRHEVAKYLVSRGAETDIYVACALGDMNGVLRALDHNPDVIRLQIGKKYFPQKNDRAGGTIYIFGFGWGRTPHMVAHKFGHREVFELLMQRSSPWLRLTHACELHDQAMAEQIVREHPGVAKDVSAMAARRIIGATMRNNTRAVEMLLAFGWPVNVANDLNQTPLHYAAWHGNLTLVNALLQRGSTVNVFENEHGGTPLAWTFHGSLNSWHRDNGDYPGVTKALFAAGAHMPKAERPWSAAEDVLEELRARGEAV